MFEATFRYNSNKDKQTIEGSEEYVDSLIVPGRMVIANQKALPQRLRSFNETAGVEYYLQPSVTDFRVGTDFREDGEIRPWHWQYVDTIGPALEEPLAKHDHVDASELPAETVDPIIKADIEYQETIVPKRIEDNAGRYETVNGDDYQPKAVIPWFHKIRSRSDLDTYASMLDTAIDTAQLRIKPVIFTTKGFIRRESHRGALATLVDRDSFQDCFLWVEDLDKHGTNQSDYDHVTDLVQRLTAVDTPPHFYYGDHFATLLGHLGATGTTYGAMYGEDAVEKTEQRGGGGMMPRYYVSEVKDFLQISATVDIQQRVGADMCECDVCQRQFDDWFAVGERYDGDDDDDNIQTPLQKHHLRVRWRQIRESEDEELDESLERIDEAYSRYAAAFLDSNQVSNTKALDYLPMWKAAIESASEQSE
ncbi:hypothetical protein ACFQL9_13315 [Halobaculum lipolyticum]|uniref:Uncharacterized protein n=1 Tax=Halobaculum lipolyticum TaxID=3032001 RepID=A0ABD5WBH5_9EURY